MFAPVTVQNVDKGDYQKKASATGEGATVTPVRVLFSISAAGAFQKSENQKPKLQQNQTMIRKRQSADAVVGRTRRLHVKNPRDFELMIVAVSGRNGPFCRQGHNDWSKLAGENSARQSCCPPFPTKPADSLSHHAGERAEMHALRFQLPGDLSN